jgi:hypothetical protein
MEVALEMACEVIGVGSEGHEARRYIASKIVECAKSGDGTLGGLTKAGGAAATELRAMLGELYRRSKIPSGSGLTALAETTLH